MGLAAPKAKIAMQIFNIFGVLDGRNVGVYYITTCVLILASTKAVVDEGRKQRGKKVGKFPRSEKNETTLGKKTILKREM